MKYYDYCEQAYKNCDFRFSGYAYGVPEFYIDNYVVDRAFTPKIVSKVPGEILGVLNSNNITPEFIFNYGAKPITHFGNPNFTPTHFKPFSIKYTKGSGIGHQTFHGNQLHVARGKCVRVYFTSYQLLKYHYGPVKENKNNVPKYKNKCVVFKTY